jgi:hypothetical protein
MAIRAREPAVPPRRRPTHVSARRPVARPAGNRRRQNVVRRRHDHPTGIRLARSKSAQPDLTAAAPGRVLAMAEQRSGASITDGAAQVRDPSYQTGTRTPRPRPSNSVPPPLNRMLCRAISRNHALRSALSGEPRGRAAVSQPTTAGVRRLGQRGKHIGLLVKPAAPLTDIAEHLSQRFPESIGTCAVALTLGSARGTSGKPDRPRRMLRPPGG